MLKQRLLTAFALALALTALIFLSPTLVFAALLAVAIGIGAHEWNRLAGFASRALQGVFFLVIVGGFAGLWWMFRNQPQLTIYLLATAAVWWLLATLWLAFFSQRLHLRALPVPLRILLGALLLLPPWYALTVMHGDPRFGPGYVYFLLWVTSWADSGAYFAGRKFGKTKLAPVISPGKTWEGVVGGFVAVAIVAAAGSALLDLGTAQAVWLVAVSLAVVPFCIVGDLLESLFKRQAQLKDSGQLLPGHGGMLDRIDSITAAAPLFLFALLLGAGL